jgi:hypothetical protein
MPNWCSNTLTVFGETQQVLDFTEQAAKHQEVSAVDPVGQPIVFSLDRFVPCPEDLTNANESAFATVGYQAFYPGDLDRRVAGKLDGIDTSPGVYLAAVLASGGIDSVLKYHWVREAGIETQEELQEFLRQKDPRYEEEGRQRASNFEKYGYGSWYDWSLANWGTKWDVTCTEMDYLDNGDNTSSVTYHFESAWSPPETAIDKMSQAAPDLTFRLHYQEEGVGFRGFKAWVGGNVTEEGSEDYAEEEGESEDE